MMKKREWRQAERPWRLAVEDPQQLGRDIGSGTYNMRNVQHLFAAAAATLRDCSHPKTEEQQWTLVQVLPWHSQCYGAACASMRLMLPGFRCSEQKRRVLAARHHNTSRNVSIVSWG